MPTTIIKQYFCYKVCGVPFWMGKKRTNQEVWGEFKWRIRERIHPP